MTSEKSEKRDSRALEPQLITDRQARAEAEARNVLRQYDAGIAAMIDEDLSIAGTLKGQRVGWAEARSAVPTQSSEIHGDT